MIPLVLGSSRLSLTALHSLSLRQLYCQTACLQMWSPASAQVRNNQGFLDLNLQCFQTVVGASWVPFAPALPCAPKTSSLPLVSRQLDKYFCLKLHKQLVIFAFGTNIFPHGTPRRFACILGGKYVKAAISSTSHYLSARLVLYFWNSEAPKESYGTGENRSCRTGCSLN